MSRRRGGVATARVRATVAANNATALHVWTGANTITGDPLNSNGNTPPITDTKLLEWVNQRKLKGWVHSGIESELLFGSDRYTADGTLPAAPSTSARAWYQRALLNQWGVPANTKTWFQRIAELGVTSVAAFHDNTFPPPTKIAFGAAFHDDTAWGASTVAGALTPTAGSFLADYIARIKSLYAAGFTGDGHDLEPTQQWGYPYAGMPGGYTLQQHYDALVLRARQMANILVTFMPVAGGPTYTVYYLRTTGSLNELVFYITNNGSVASNIFSGYTSDLFVAALGIETGIQAVYYADQSYYRNDVNHIPGDTTANDDDVTRFANAYSYDQGGRFAVWSQRLAACVASGAITNQQALTAISKLYHCAFIWLTDNVEGGFPSQTVAEGAISIREAVKWSMARRFYVYVRGQFINEATPDHQFDQYEPAFATHMVDATITDPPTVTITVPTSNAMHSSAGASLTVSGTCTTNTAVWYVKVTNVTTGVSYMATKTWVNDDPQWNPLSSSAKPRRTVLGRVLFHDEFTCAVAGNVGANEIRVDAYSTHGVVGSDSLTWTRTS